MIVARHKRRGVGGSLSGQPFQYVGMYLDAETGLYYDRARYYSTSLGRFLQDDPVGYREDLNLYSYVGNDPTDMTDPTGMFLWPWEQAVVIPANDERIVGYEIGHAATCTQDDGPNRMNNVKQDENPVMQGLGQPARTQYASPNSSSGAEFARGNDKAGSSHLCTGSRIPTTGGCS